MKIPEIPITGNDLLLGVVCPALVTVSVMGLGALLPFRRRGWIGPVAIALGFAVGYPLINGALPKFPPNSAGDWLFWLAIPIALLAGVLASVRLPSIVRTIIATAVLGATLYLMMQPAAASRTAGEWWTLWAILTVVLSIDFWFIDSAIRSDSTHTSFVGFLCIMLGACVLIQMSGSFKYAMQGGSLVAAGAAGLVVIAMGLSRSALANGVALVGVGIVGCLLAVSIEPLFVNVKIANATLIAAAPVLLWTATFIRLPNARWWIRSGIRLALPAIPVLAALAIAGAKAMADLNSTGADDYYYGP